jgi:tetratricopeptide (TPR) repeat protein
MQRSVLNFFGVILLSISALATTKTAAVSPEALLQAGQVDDAISVLNQRLATSNNDAEAHNLLSRAFYAVSNYDRAIGEGERAVSLAPDNADYHLWLGRAYGRKAEHASWFSAASLAGKMRDQFERAVQLNGDDVDARTDLAEFYIEAPSIVGGGRDKAQVQAQQVEPLDASTAHWIRARLAEKDKRYDVAEAEYKAAIQDSGDRADNWLSLASFYRRRNRIGDMENAINKAVSSQKHPKDKSTFFDAATLLMKTGRSLPQAAQLLAKYLSSNNKVEDAPAFQAHYLLGQIYEKQGDNAAAVHEYEAALKLAKDYKDAREALARVGPASSMSSR